MAFQKSKRRSLPLAANSSASNAAVIPISIEAMVLEFKGQKAYFKRLKYKGCPAANRKGDLPSNVIDMNRDEFVSSVYDLFKEFPRNSLSGGTYFQGLINYVKTLDEHQKKVNFSENSVLWYYEHKRSLMIKGVIRKGTLSAARTFLSVVLKSMGDVSLARKLPTIKYNQESKVSHTTLSDSELTSVGKKLMSAYMGYSRFALNDAEPTICPLFDEADLRRKGFDEKQIAALEKTARNRVRQEGMWRNQMTRLAFMIISLWCGANTSPLAGLKRRDAVFRKGDGDTYEFNSVKARALYARQKLGFGFGKRTKLFIENWLIVSEKLAPGDDAPLFPFFDLNGKLNPRSGCFRRPHHKINTALQPQGYPPITTSIFRKTRSSILMRAFNDVFVVADANRTSTETAFQSYLFGVSEAHEMQLAGAFVAQQSMVQGVGKNEAIQKAADTFKDPLTEFEWSRKNHRLPNKTPTGVRCQEPFGKRAKRSLIPLRDLSSSASGACVDFLGCFDCEHHALIAEKDDIWLMMSFKDSVIEVIARPSHNSAPARRWGDTLFKVDAILAKYNEKAPDEYRAAFELNKQKPHPLYDEGGAIDDLLEIYNESI